MTNAPQRFSTKKQVDDFKPKAARYTVRHRKLEGLYLRVTPKGAKTYWAVARNPIGDQVWAKIGKGSLHPDKAKEKAEEAISRIQEGKPAFEPPKPDPDTFEAVAGNYLKRHVEKKGLRSKPEIERILNKYIYPVWKDRPFEDIKRSDVNKLLDTVEDNNGSRQADMVLAVVRKMMYWHAARTDDYVIKIVPDMCRYNRKDHERDRILDDDEIRAAWKVAVDKSTYGALVRFAVLTGQRRAKIVALKWADVTDDGIWNIQTENREKGNPGVLKLPEQAFAIIHDQMRINDFVFAGRGDGHFARWSSYKRAFDVKMLEALQEGALERGDDAEKAKLPAWVFHDLRRTCRSLLSRAGVRPDIAERVLGHARQGVEATYDQYDYADEMAHALERLAGLIETILNPTPEDDKVVSLEAKLSKKRIPAIR